MNRSQNARLTRLEGDRSVSGDIAIWCEDESEVPGTIDDLIARGQITESDRGQCVFWERARCAPGTHEQRLRELA